MATTLAKPSIRISQAFASVAPTFLLPDLMPCIIAPAFLIVAAKDSDGDLLSAANVGNYVNTPDRKTKPKHLDDTAGLAVLSTAIDLAPGDTLPTSLVLNAEPAEPLPDSGYLTLWQTGGTAWSFVATVKYTGYTASTLTLTGVTFYDEAGTALTIVPIRMASLWASADPVLTQYLEWGLRLNRTSTATARTGVIATTALKKVAGLATGATLPTEIESTTDLTSTLTNDGNLISIKDAAGAVVLYFVYTGYTSNTFTGLTWYNAAQVATPTVPAAITEGGTVPATTDDLAWEQRTQTDESFNPTSTDTEIVLDYKMVNGLPDAGTLTAWSDTTNKGSFTYTGRSVTTGKLTGVNGANLRYTLTPDDVLIYTSEALRYALPNPLPANTEVMNWLKIADPKNELSIFIKYQDPSTGDVTVEELSEISEADINEQTGSSNIIGYEIVLSSTGYVEAIDITQNLIGRSSTAMGANPGLTGEIYIGYRALRCDVSPANPNAVLTIIEGPDQIEDYFGVGSETTDNSLALAGFIAASLAGNYQIALLGIDEVTINAPQGTADAYSRAYDFLETKDVYILAPMTHSDVVHQFGSSHVTNMSSPDEEGERIILINPLVPLQHADVVLASGTGFSGGATTEDDGDGNGSTWWMAVPVRLDTMLGSTLTISGTDIAADEESESNGQSRLYIIIAGDGVKYYIKRANAFKNVAGDQDYYGIAIDARETRERNGLSSRKFSAIATVVLTTGYYLIAASDGSINSTLASSTEAELLDSDISTAVNPYPIGGRCQVGFHVNASGADKVFNRITIYVANGEDPNYSSDGNKITWSIYRSTTGGAVFTASEVEGDNEKLTWQRGVGNAWYLELPSSVTVADGSDGYFKLITVNGDGTTLADGGDNTKATIAGIDLSLLTYPVTFTVSGELPDTLYNATWGLYQEGASLMAPDGTLDKNAMSDIIRAKAESYNNRRVVSVHPDNVATEIGGIEQTIPGFYMCAALATVIGVTPPQQSMTNFPISGFTKIPRYANEFFTKSQMNKMAAGGVFQMVQDAPGAPIYCRHQLTTNVSSIQTRELSITVIVDYAAKFIRAGLRPFIGIYNITPTFIDMISTILQAQLEFLKNKGAILSGSIVSIAQDEDAPDSLVVDVLLNVPYPCNYIHLTLVVGDNA